MFLLYSEWVEEVKRTTYASIIIPSLGSNVDFGIVLRSRSNNIILIT